MREKIIARINVSRSSQIRLFILRNVLRFVRFISDGQVDIEYEYLDSLREPMASYAHRAWSGWMKYLFSKGTFSEDGTWTMPKWAVDRWQRQMNTAYYDLPDNERNSDRVEADDILGVFRLRVRNKFQ